MRKIIFFILLFSSSAFGSPQVPDYLIVKNDTIPIFFLPLEEYLQENKSSYLNKILQDTARFIPQNCWRGYQAVWKLENNKLYLVDLKSCGIKELEDSKKVIKSNFPTHFEGDKVFAYWFNSSIAIPKGELLKWDYLFARTYETEQRFDFENGYLTNDPIVQNYVDLEDGFSRRNDSLVHDVLYQQISNLELENAIDSVCTLNLEILIGNEGKVSQVNSLLFNEELCEDVKKTINNKLLGFQFDIIKWNGLDYEETIYLDYYSH
jgi:hypothetical protein